MALLREWEMAGSSWVVARPICGNTAIKAELLGVRHPLTDWPIPIEYRPDLPLERVEAWGIYG